MPMRLFARLLPAVVLLVLAGCSSLVPRPDLPVEAGLPVAQGTPLDKLISGVEADRPGQSGFRLLREGPEAFAIRAHTALLAGRSLDVQTYIWHDDATGGYLAYRALEAADRGVKVRLLVDDMDARGKNYVFAALDAHPNIELRLYNPFAYRGSRALGYVTDFQRLNKRMHNKSFTADNQVSVVGGRNVANEYFGAAGAIGFADLDVLAIGAVVPLVSAQFDRYWNSASAYPAAQFLGPPPAAAAQLLQAAFAKARADPASAQYLKAVIESPLLANLLNRSLDLDWTHARLLYDDPAKTLDRSARTDILLFPALMESLGKPVKSFDIVSPYFVPGDDGTALLGELARSGVQVRVLTNSLASSDESVVHAGYMKRRRDLLRAGVKLYELKPTANEQSMRVRGRFGAGKVAGLHAKTYAVDGQRIFVGSFNFDQRSARLNTELGVVLDSPLGAGELAELFDRELRALAYEVRLAPQGEGLVWVEHDASGAEIRYDVDPQTDWGLRFKVGLLSGLPIDWLL